MKPARMPLRILIAIPTHATCTSLFTYDLSQLCLHTAAALPPDEGHSINTVMVTHTYIHRARQDLAEFAIASGATHVLWLDSDMRFPRDTIERLLAHMDKRRIVGVNYSTRSVPADFVAIKHLPVDEKDVGLKLITREDSTGLEEVDAMGFGVVMMPVSVFNEFPDPATDPWFWFRMGSFGNHVGEDVHFFQLAASKGIKSYVDHDLSKECAHVGELEFLLSHAETEYPR